MTAGQRLIEQGLKEACKFVDAMLLRQLRNRFGEAVNAQIEEQVAMASVTQVEDWSSRVITAATLADVLAD